MEIITDPKRINEIFDRGIVSEILPSREELFQRLTSGDRLKIYIGADPTSSSLHLSHAKNYMFLEELRKLGHEAIILVGDFTAQIGDPSERSDTRKQLSEEDVKENVKTWIEQIKPLMDFSAKDNPPRILYNSAWLAPLNLKDLVPLASNFTVQQMMERDMFQRRLKNNTPIYLHEFLYPLMQGYDSVAMDVDAELCGTDQIFNALTGRTLLKRIKNKEKFVVAVNLMENPKTGELMSKSRGNGVFLSSSPTEMFGAIMAQPDEMIEVLFINCTRITLAEKDGIMKKGPREAKAIVAFEIVKRFYGEKASRSAQKEFDATFAKGQTPTDMQGVEADGTAITEAIILAIGGSKTEAKRLIDDGAVKINEQKTTEWSSVVHRGDVIQIGPHRFFKIV